MFDTMNNLGELQRRSDDRLNALIAIVDDLIRKGPLQPPRA